MTILEFLLLAAMPLLGAASVGLILWKTSTAEHRSFYRSPQWIHPWVKSTKLFRQMSERLGLEVERDVARGVKDGLRITCTECRFTDSVRSPVDLRVEAVEPLSGFPTMVSEHQVAKASRQRDIQVGDPAFDREVHVKGDEAVSLALLDSETRRLVRREVVEQGTYIGDNRIARSDVSLSDVESHVLDELLKLGRRLLAGERDVGRRLYANSVNDPSSAVRLRNLTMLLRSYSRSAEAQLAARDAHASDDLRMRLAGAMHLGVEGRDAVIEVARAHGAGEDLRLKAVTHLARSAPTEKVASTLKGLLGSELASIRLAAAEGLGWHRRADAVEGIVALLDGADARTAEAVAKSLGRIGGPDAEAALCRQLKRREPRVRIAAARALGRVGTAPSVELLQELGRARLTPAAVKHAARCAAFSIQGRLKPTEAGGLSVAAGGEGEGGLSLGADHPSEGGLSVHPREPGEGAVKDQD
jgi:hypothetical protein